MPPFISRRYSYAAVLAAAGLGAAAPQAAGPVLAPLLAVGLVGLGIAHGACDQLVVPGARPAVSLRSGRYWGWFLLGYLGLAGLVLALWWRWPAMTVGLFFGMTVWHWGSADAPEQPQRPGQWLAHSLLRGLLLFAVPALAWPADTLGIINGLLTFAGARPVAAGAFGAAATGLGLVVAAGHLALWGGYAARRHWAALGLDARDVAVLLLLFVSLPPLLSVGVYFIFWHSLQHVLRLTPLLGYAAPAGVPGQPGRELLRQLGFFIRRAAPLLLLSCAALLVLGYLLAARLPDGAAWFSLALVVASVVTLPHAVLVTLVMDAAKWRPRPAGPAATAAGPAQRVLAS
ncbi:Brp/Blh family beta-carotene 15,15'-dioxygenase [uncultured Hymenobacter sp.]|uniref:Brp/Blh family beta-carotene 15,15'-dioxygenase n=1 Tax=uncultured Hymenobacter sp. TaxID=170016 RepID=UPI0035CB32D1